MVIVDAVWCLGIAGQVSGDKRTFVRFLLEPLYKIYSHVLGSEGRELSAVLQRVSFSGWWSAMPQVFDSVLDVRGQVGVYLKKEQLQQDPKPLLRTALSKFFGSCAGFLQLCVDHFPSPVTAARTKVAHSYTGDLNTPVGYGMLGCDKRAPAMVNITKVRSKH